MTNENRSTEKREEIMTSAYFERERILKEHARKELLKLYRKTLTTISNTKLISLRVKLSAMFEVNAFHFDITVFDTDGDNRTFTAYDFSDSKKNTALVDNAIKLIKGDDFQRIVKAFEY